MNPIQATAGTSPGQGIRTYPPHCPTGGVATHHPRHHVTARRGDGVAGVAGDLAGAFAIMYHMQPLLP